MMTAAALTASAARRERERIELQEKILDAARELFATKGYNAVTMREIAAQIEYSPTAIYLHFKDKEALVRELCNRDFLALAREFLAIAAIPDAVERIARIGERYAEFGLSNPHHYRVMFMDHPAVETLTAEEAGRKGDPEQDAYAFLRQAVVQARDAGRLRPEYADPDLAAQTFWAGVHGAIALELSFGCDQWLEMRPARDRVKAMIGALLRGMTHPARGKSGGAEPGLFGA